MPWREHLCPYRLLGHSVSIFCWWACVAGEVKGSLFSFRREYIVNRRNNIKKWWKYFRIGKVGRISPFKIQTKFCRIKCTQIQGLFSIFIIYTGCFKTFFTTYVNKNYNINLDCSFALMFLSHYSTHW